MCICSVRRGWLISNLVVQLRHIGIMKVTAFVIYFVKICSFVTGNRSYMMLNTEKYRPLLDLAFWITCAKLVACSITLSVTISRGSTDFILITVMRFSLLAASISSGLYNLAYRRKRYLVEKACSNLLQEYGIGFSSPFVLFIPISIVTVTINTVTFNKDKTFMFVMFCFLPSIVNESYINLRTLAISKRFAEIESELSKINPSNTDQTILSAMEAHRDCSRLVEMLNGCHMLDYFLLSFTCLIRNIYIIIGVFQDVKNGVAAFDGKYAEDMISTVLYFFTVTGRFFLTCWSGTHLTATSESCLETVLNYKFHYYGMLKQKSQELVDVFIHQLQERTISLSVFRMFDLGLGTFTTFVEVTVTYAIVVVNTIGAKTVAQLASDTENSTEASSSDDAILQDKM